MKNVLTLLIKSVLLPLELKTTTSEIDAAIQNKIYGPGITTLKISNEEMEYIMEIVKYREESCSLNR